MVGRATGPVTGEQTVFRAEAAALLYVARKTVGAVDVTLDCKGVPQTVARTQGWKSEDLFQEIREQAERVQTTWVSSHMPWETFREKFGAQNWWRWQANQNVDKLVQDAANQRRDPAWEQSVLNQDAAAVQINLFLASRVQQLFQYDKDEGPIVIFPENQKEEAQKPSKERKKPGPKVKQRGLTTKGRKAQPGAKPGAASQATEPNKRQQLEALLAGRGPDLGHSWVEGHRSRDNLCVNCSTCGHFIEQVDSKDIFSKKVRHPCQWREPSAPMMGEHSSHKMVNAGKMWLCCRCGLRQWIGRVDLFPSLAKQCRQVYTGNDQWKVNCIKKFAPQKGRFFKAPDKAQAKATRPSSQSCLVVPQPQTGEKHRDDGGVDDVTGDAKGTGVGVSPNQSTRSPRAPHNLNNNSQPPPSANPTRGVRTSLFQPGPQGHSQEADVASPGSSLPVAPLRPPSVHPTSKTRPKAKGKAKPSEDSKKQTKLKF